MKSKNVSRIKFGLSRIVALFMAAAMLTLGFASCSSDSGDEAKTYFVKVEKAEHGTVVASAEKAEAGKTITLEAKADEGYVFEAYSVKDADGKAVEVKDGAFKMPASDVIVSVSFKEKETTPDTPTDTTKPTDSTTNPSGTNTNPTDSTTNPSGTNTNPTDSTTNPSGTSTNPAGSTTNPAGTTTPEQQPASGSGEQPEVTKYTVTFDLDGVKTTQSVESGNKATEPEKPSKTGYTFEGWFDGSVKFDFNTAITGAKTLTAKWSPATNTAYKVLHYKENANDDGYTLEDTDNLTGTTAAQTQAVAKTYAHFTAGTVTQTAIAADGSTEVRINYTRETVTFTIDLAGGTLGEQTGTVTKTGKYGQSISVANPTRQGFTFDGWNAVGGTIPATFDETKTYTALWTSAGGITATIAPLHTIAITKADVDGSITLTAESGFTDYSWLINGKSAASVAAASVSSDGTVLTLTKAQLSDEVAYQVALNAAKNGITYGAQITVSK